MSGPCTNPPAPIDAFKEDRSGKAMTYLAPGQTLVNNGSLTVGPDHWHRFILWDKGNDVEAETFCPRLWDWCEDNKLRLPTGNFVRGFGAPLIVKTASKAKALLFKLTFGGNVWEP